MPLTITYTGEPVRVEREQRTKQPQRKYDRRWAFERQQVALVRADLRKAGLL
jgi:hypothetical protein